MERGVFSMSSMEGPPRSPELMSRDDTALLVVDVQQRLLPAIAGRDRIVWNIRRLVDGARLLGVVVAATEQYPKGLGATIPVLAERLGAVPSKLMFSCRECSEIFSEFAEQGRRNVLVVGIESHVCVQQTVLDLLGEGFRVFVAVDAVGSRYEIDYQTALRRMETSGATLTTTEAALFEWCEVAGTDAFKQISQLVREDPPETES
jgi:nicotinamidase-related amidase